MKTCATCKTEKPRGDFYVRRASNDGLARVCKPCSVEQATRWHKANPEKARASISNWNKNNAERRRAIVRTSVRKWREANPQKARNSSSKWQKANRGCMNALRQKRRALQLQAVPAWADQQYIRLFYEIARLESERTGRTVHVDHIVPLNSPLVCGLHTHTNLQLLFAEDNGSKGNRHWPGMPEGAHT